MIRSIRRASFLGVAGFLLAFGGRLAFADPVVPGFTVEKYADVPGPISLSFDASGALFCGRDVPGSMGGDTVKIHRIGPGGSPVEEFGTSEIPDPDGAFVDLDGAISGTAGAVIVCGDAGSANGQIVAVLPDQSLVTLSPASPVMSNPNYMARGRDGLLLADSGLNQIFQFVAPGPPTIFATPPSAPYHMAVDATPRLYVSHADGAIRVWDADGVLVDDQYATGLGNGPTIALARGGAFGSDLYAINPSSGELVRIASDKSTTVIGTGFPASLGAMTFGPDRALYVALYEDGKVLRVSGAAESDAFFLPTKLKYKANAAAPAKSKLVASGVFDTGSKAVDLSAAATLEIGTMFSVSVPGLVVKGTAFVFQQDGVKLTIRPTKTGTSRATFKLIVTGDLTTSIDPDQSVKLHFTNAAIDAVGEVKLTAGKYKFGRIRGALVAPALFPAKLKAKLGDGATDSFKLTAGLASGGVTPSVASDVTLELGATYSVIIPAVNFVRVNDSYRAIAPLSVILDYAREKLVVKAGKVELGELAEGPNALRIGLVVGTDDRAVQVRSVRKGKALRY